MMDTLTIDVVLAYYGCDLSRVQRHGWRNIKCCFHPDRVASASVNLEIGCFRCHACCDDDGKPLSGNPVTLIMKVEHLDYEGACEFAQGVLGASVPQLREATGRPKTRRRPRRRHSIFED